MITPVDVKEPREIAVDGYPVVGEEVNERGPGPGSAVVVGNPVEGSGIATRPVAGGMGQARNPGTVVPALAAVQSEGTPPTVAAGLEVVVPTGQA